jgi:PAS domain S-box-containing protein
MVQNLSTQADMIANSCKDVLALKDIKAVEDILGGLRRGSSIVFGCVHANSGEILTAYYRDETDEGLHSHELQEGGHLVEGGIITVFKKIYVNGEGIGTLCIQSDLCPVRETLRRNIPIIIGILLFSALISYLISAGFQKLISGPILGLGKVAKSITINKDYSMRVSNSSSDEVGLLINAFNQMLDQIQQHDMDLTESNNQLEIRIKERTADLIASNEKLSVEVAERRQTEESLRRRDAILEAVNLAAEKFIRFSSWQQNIQEVMRYLGMASQVSRVYIFENGTTEDNEVLTSQRFEWVASGIKSEIENPELQGLSFRESGFCRWEENLGYRKAIHGLVRDFPEVERKLLEPQEILSILVVPVFVGIKWWGFIGFDDCRAEREWTRVEIDSLQTAANILGAAIRREEVGESLRKAVEFQQKLISTVATGIFTVDKDGNITTVNDEICHITGYSFEELVGKHCDILGNQSCRHNCDLFDLSLSEPIFRQNCTVSTKDGRSLKVLKNADILCDEDGQVVGGIESFIDVTDLYAAKENAEKANKAKSEFLANMSHELRTPLHGILSFSSFGIEKHADATPEKLLDYFQKIHQSGSILLRMLNDLLDLAKLESGRIAYDTKMLNLVLLVTSVEDEFKWLLSERHLVIEHGELECERSMKADPEKIKQVLRNLLSNAIKFSPEGGSISISVQGKSNSAVVSVSDQGPGVPENELKLVFDKFVQSSKTKSGAGGTGLGLAICKEIVSAHNGRIWAENRPEGGARFSFEIPIVERRSRRRETV